MGESGVIAELSADEANLDARFGRESGELRSKGCEPARVQAAEDGDLGAEERKAVALQAVAAILRARG